MPLATALPSAALFLLPFDVPGLPFRTLLDAVTATEAEVRRLIAARRAAGTDGGDVLSMLVSARDEADGALTEEQVISHISVLLIAGHVTSYNALGWLTLLLALHPRVAADLLDDIQATTSGAPPTVEQLAAMPLLDAVVKEGLRLMPPAPLNTRFAARDTTLGGHDIPAGAHVVMSIYHTHRMTGIYPDPARFDPSRWATLKPALHAYGPFGSGPRTCIGGPFATMAIKLVLSMTLSRYRLALPPGTRVDRFASVTLGIRGRLPMRVHAQDRAFAPATDVRGDVREMVELPS
jgi:cytochrome P450